MYLEFKNVDSKYGIRITNDTEFWLACLTLFRLLLVWHILCYLFVKFMITGRTWTEARELLPP